MTPLRVAVVGVGHLGKEHARIVASLPDADLVAIVDPNEAQARAIAERCGSHAVTDHRAVLDQVDAAVIAAPTTYHHAVAVDFLRKGVPVLVEKPITSTITQARELVELARAREVVLQVGHIERFNRRSRTLQTRPLQPCYLRAERRRFTGRSTDVGVVFDLMIHDLDLVLALGRRPDPPSMRLASVC
ncbi:MAG: Gfo/Idh/MocA family oxidoreductase [Gemmataceae bacterium]